MRTLVRSRSRDPRPSTTNFHEGLCGRPADHPRCPGAQPQGRLARPAARRAHRVHRPLRLRQVESRVRHHLRRGPAAVRRVAVGVRPAVPRADGQAGRGLHRGSVPGGLHRPEVDLEEPSLDRRHDHRGLRLPASALRPRRPAALPQVWPPDRPADPAADRRPGPRARGGQPLPGARAGHPRAQGRVRRALPPAPDPGLLEGPGQRRDPPAHRPAQARQAEEAHDRGRGRPPRGEGVRQAPPDRLGGDGPRPVLGPGHPRLRRPPRGPRAPRADLLRAPRLPLRRPVVRGARAAVVLLQLALRRLHRLPRPRHPDGGRPGAGDLRPLGDPGRGRHRALVGRSRLRLLHPAARRARGGARVRPEHPVGGPARPRRARSILDGHSTKVHVRHRNRYGRERSYYTSFEGVRPYIERRHREAESDTSRERFEGYMREVPCPTCQGSRLKPVSVVGHPRRQEHRRGDRDADQRVRGVPARPRPDRPRAADRRACPQGDPGAAELPARRRPRLPLPRPALRVAVGWRGAADPARHADRRRSRRRALRARRAVDRSPPARQPPAHRDPGPAPRPRQHADRRGARRGHHPHG